MPDSDIDTRPHPVAWEVEDGDGLHGVESPDSIHPDRLGDPVTLSPQVIGARETHTRRRIRKAVESRGYKVAVLYYESVRNGGEMDGWTGGWTLVLNRSYLPNTFPGDEIYGFGVNEVLAYIDYWLVPEGECPCDRSHDPLRAVRLINDPQKPTHDPSCEFHIPYQLRWWNGETR